VCDGIEVYALGGSSPRPVSFPLSREQGWSRLYGSAPVSALRLGTAARPRIAALASGECTGANLRPTVFASRRSGVEVVGEARRAGLCRGRVTEHRLPLSRHDCFVGQDDHEINDGHKHDEIDDRGYETPEV
jgi:hypothetical protein